MINRIKKLIKYKQLSASHFADELGVPRSTVSHILSGRNNPSLEFIQKVLDAYPDIQTAWLVRGIGNMSTESVPSLFPDDAEEQSDINQLSLPVAELSNRNDRSHSGASDKLISGAGDEEAASYQKSAKQPKKSPTSSASFGGGDKEAVRVMLLYADGTFESFSQANVAEDY
jgi:transcriptional regulator with XRE-family HTH domain